MTFKPSIQQKNYFKWVETGFGSVILEAVAGSGKTTTLIKGLDYMSGSIFFGAFNKKIADEIYSKCPKLPNLKVATMHSIGLSIWKKHINNNRLKVDAFKCSNILASILDYDDAKFVKSVLHESHTDLKSTICNLVSFAKQSVLNQNSPIEQWEQLIDHFDVDTCGYDDFVINYAKALLAESIKESRDIVDFDDMIYCPVITKGVVFETFDWVLIDEAQDTNEARRLLSINMLSKNGRLVAVGDRHQAIYGFTGASSNSLDLIKEAVDASYLPLTVSYRCPKNVVSEAKHFVSHIESHKKAIDGVVTSLEKYDDIFEHVNSGDAILCRYNAPLLSLVYDLISRGIPAKVEGRDFGKNLKSVVKKCDATSFQNFRTNLYNYLETETDKYNKQMKQYKIQSVSDKVRCIDIIIDRVIYNSNTNNVVKAICDEIDRLFYDNESPAITLSSIHKAKGREWDNVFIMKSKECTWATMDWQKEAEVNIKYVGITRAKKGLFYVPEQEK